MSSGHLGYFDLQVNGYAGIDFNADGLSPEGLHAACERLVVDGVDAILATIITDQVDVMCKRISTIVRLREQDPLAHRVIAGLHIEGPFINETDGYRGAHPADAIIPAGMEAMASLLEAGGGLTRIVTLAPERDAGLKVTRMLADRGILVSAGHTNASLGELEAAIDAGLSMFTHLGNGCAPWVPRHDNVIQRALSLAGRLWLCFIADGAHIPLFALRNYLRIAGVEHTIVVTDAIAAAGLGPGRYTLSRRTVDVGEDLVVRSGQEGILAGSAVTMKRSEENLLVHVGLTGKEAVILTRTNPRAAVRV